MRTIKLLARHPVAILFLLVLFSGCRPLISLYDQYAYTQAISLKVDMQNLIDRSGTVDYADARPDIEKLNLQIRKAYEYAKGRSLNSISTKQYEVILSETGFYSQVLKDWKAQTRVSETAAEEKKLKIGQLMDKIIQLENGKNKPDTNP
jgi:hypothetical protein